MSHNETNRLRTLEGIALLSTVVAVGLTALLEPATAAVESNPLAVAMLETLGWTGAGIVAVVAEAGLFGAWRSLSSRGYHRPALVASGGIAAVGLADVALNLVVLSRIGIPETARVAHYSGLVAPVAIVAAVAFVRPDPRPLLSAGRGLTLRLSKVDRQTVGALAIALLIISSISVQPALVAADDHRDGDTLIDDFEGGVNSGWTSGMSHSTEVAFNGTGSGVVGSSGETSTLLEFDEPDKNVSLFFQTPDAGSFDRLQFHNTSESGQAARFKVDNVNGQLYLTEELATSREMNVSISPDTWYRIKLGKVSNGNENGTVTILDANGNVLAQNTTAKYDTFLSNQFSIDKVKIRGDGAHLDYISAGQDPDGYGGYTVDGTIKNADGSGIDGATVELRQSGSVQQSATTSSDGSYTFSTVSDGDYTVRASGSGYQNSSESITVSGSPKTVDLTLYESGSYNQPIILSDDTGKFYGHDPEIQVWKFTGADADPIYGGPFSAPDQWQYQKTTTPNWKNTTNPRLKDGERYAFVVVRDAFDATHVPRGPAYEYVGFEGNDSADTLYLRIREQSETNETVAADTDEGLTVTYNGTNGSELDDYEFDVGGGRGSDGYTGGIDFDSDSPAPDYQSTIDDDLLDDIQNRTDSNSGEVGDEVEYNGTLSNGETFNGTTSVLDSFPGFTSGNSSDSGAFGPVGGGSGGTTTGQQIAGIGLVAGAGYLAYRRFGNGNLAEQIPGVGR